MEKKDIPIQCACGTKFTFDTEIGPFIQLSDCDYGVSRQLFEGELDYYRCPGCDAETDIENHIVVDLNFGQKLIIYLCGGEQFSSQYKQEFLDEAGFQQGDWANSLDELKCAYAAAIKVNAKLFFESKSVVDRDKSSMIEQALWKKLTANQFVAVFLLTSVQLPKIVFELKEGKPEDVYNFLIALQAEVWLLLVASWCENYPDSSRMADDVAHYAPSTALVLHQAISLFHSATSNLTNYCLEQRYLLRMFGAYLATALSLDEHYEWEHNQEWANILIQTEFELAKDPDYRANFTPPIDLAYGVKFIPYANVLNACAGKLNSLMRGGSADDFDIFQDIVDRTGLPALNHDIQAALQIDIGSAEVRIEDLLEILKNQLNEIKNNSSADATRVRSVLESHTLLIENAPPENHKNLVNAVATEALKLTATSNTAKADVISWQCAYLLRLGHTRAALAVVGEQQQPWEISVSLHPRVCLWMERSNTLRQLGRYKEALGICESVLKAMDDANMPPDKQVMRNRGILLRETGEHQKALDLFFQLLPTATIELKLRLYESIATTYSTLNKIADTIPYLEQALVLCKGKYAGEKTKFSVMLASCLVGPRERRREGKALLKSIPVESLTHPALMTPCASAWATLSFDSNNLDDNDLEYLETLIRHLYNALDNLVNSQNYLAVITLARTLAVLTFRLDMPIYLDTCKLAHSMAIDKEGTSYPDLILLLASHYYDASERAHALSLIADLPNVVIARYGTQGSLELKVESWTNLKHYFDTLSSAAYEQQDFEALQWFGEASRDIFGRSHQGTFAAPEARNLGVLPNRTIVLEWVSLDNCLVGLRTTKNATGHIETRPVKAPKVEFRHLSDKIQQRLSCWHAGRTGDPFDVEAWQTLTQWIQNILLDQLPDGGHLIVIQHADFAQLPWHVAAAPEWTTSYSPSWSCLLNTMKPLEWHKGSQVGVAMVPKFKEADSVLNALNQCVTAIEKLAIDIELKFKSQMSVICDSNALSAFMEESTFLIILCHGYVNYDEHVVAWMLAHEGILPLASNIASDRELGQRHRFGWRDCAALSRTPPVVISIACSSGQSHAAGIAENLGLYSQLRQTGTQTLLAPRWDIVPADVAVILTDVMNLYFNTRTTFAQALNKACLKAEQNGCPRWLAWSLALEGGWI